MRTGSNGDATAATGTVTADAATWCAACRRGGQAAAAAL